MSESANRTVATITGVMEEAIKRYGYKYINETRFSDIFKRARKDKISDDLINRGIAINGHTQFFFTKEDRPFLMKSRISTIIFLFKSYYFNMLDNLGRYIEMARKGNRGPLNRFITYEAAKWALKSYTGYEGLNYMTQIIPFRNTFEAGRFLLGPILGDIWEWGIDVGDYLKKRLNEEVPEEDKAESLKNLKDRTIRVIGGTQAHRTNKLIENIINDGEILNKKGQHILKYGYPDIIGQWFGFIPSPTKYNISQIYKEIQDAYNRGDYKSVDKLMTRYDIWEYPKEIEKKPTLIELIEERIKKRIPPIFKKIK
jgi:hypothetical protein